LQLSTNDQDREGLEWQRNLRHLRTLALVSTHIATVWILYMVWMYASRDRTLPAFLHYAFRRAIDHVYGVTAAD
jgi:hypothetical protein